jgi:RNA polymerase sigma-70 factor (ECF subfamily)
MTLHADNPVRELDDAALLAWLVSEYSRPLFRVAISVVRDHALAEDVVQETLVRAWQAYPSYRGEAPVGAWLLRIGHNVAVSTLRRRRDQATEPELLPDAPVPEPADHVVDRLAVDQLWAVLADVDPLSRAILVLRDIEGLAYEEIAEITDVTLSVVKTRLFRTRRLLALRLKEWR